MDRVERAGVERAGVERAGVERAGVERAGVGSRAGCPGSWVGVFGDSLTVLLPGGERRRAAELWPHFDEGATLDEVLDLLLASGLSQVPDFVLVSAEGDAVRVLVRGAAQVTAHTAEGLVRVRAAGRLWQEDAFTGIVALTARLPDEAIDPATSTFQIQPGLCRVGEVRWGTAPLNPEPLNPEPLKPEPLNPEPRKPEPLNPEPLAPVPLPAVEPAYSVPPATGPETEPIASVPLTPAWQDEVTGVIPAVEPSGLTLLGLGGESDAADPPATRHWEPTQPVAVLVFSHGPRVSVDRVFLIGRGPSARAKSQGAELITVPSPFQEVSSTHVEIRPGEGLDLGTAVVTDLGSTNGTLLTQPGLAPHELRPASPVSLLPGAILDLGDGVTIQVIRP